METHYTNKKLTLPEDSLHARLPTHKLPTNDRYKHCCFISRETESRNVFTPG